MGTGTRVFNKWFWGFANPFETRLVEQLCVSAPRTAPVPSAWIRWSLALVLPHLLSWSPCHLTTRDALSQKVYLWGLRTISLPQKPPAGLPSFLSASCEDK